jgi:hypothetical protein
VSILHSPRTRDKERGVRRSTGVGAPRPWATVGRRRVQVVMATASDLEASKLSVRQSQVACGYAVIRDVQALSKSSTPDSCGMAGTALQCRVDEAIARAARWCCCPRVGPPVQRVGEWSLGSSPGGGTNPGARVRQWKVARPNVTARSHRRAAQELDLSRRGTTPSSPRHRKYPGATRD